MNIQLLKCPKYGAAIDVEEGMEYCFCKYSGCKVIVTDENQTTCIRRS